MVLVKYRMINEDGSWIETLNLQEAELHGNYVIIEEDIIENNEENN